MDKCVICGAEYNDANPTTRPPACSKECWQIWIKVVDHKGEPCWVPGCLEVFCGIRTEGCCFECDVFKIEEEINKRGLNKEILMGDY